MSGGVSGMMDINMDKLLEDSVPCRVRAKRGCATHPRSIAERVFALKFHALQSSLVLLLMYLSFLFSCYELSLIHFAR